MQKLKDFFRFVVVAVVVGLSVSYVLAEWSNPGGPPTPDPGVYNAPAPINVGGLPNPQVKDGSLVINGDLATRSFFVAGGGFGLPYNQRMTIGPAAFNGYPDPDAILDIDGKIKIRSNCAGLPNPQCLGKVLTSDAQGLADWANPPVGLGRLTEGFGIDFLGYEGGVSSYAMTEIQTDGTIAVATGQSDDDGPPSASSTIQTRVATYNGVAQSACSSYQAITAISNGSGFFPVGNAVCSPFVTTAQATGASGLTLTAAGGPTVVATSGPISLAVNVGAGVIIDGTNKVALNVNEAVGAGDGLTIDSGTGKVKFENCASNETWKYNTVDGKWECSIFPTKPGDSVMYLKSKGEFAAIYPPNCPIGGGVWTPYPSVQGSTYTTDEAVGNGKYHKVRVCYKTAQACQVIYLRKNISPAPASCPFGWTLAGVSEEYAPGGGGSPVPYTNYVRTCYLCN